MVVFVDHDDDHSIAFDEIFYNFLKKSFLGELFKLKVELLLLLKLCKIIKKLFKNLIKKKF